MYDFLSMLLMLLSGIYEGFRIRTLYEAIAEIDRQLQGADLSAAVISQMQAARTASVVEIIICGALLLLTVICLLRGIKYLIVNNIIMFAKTRTSDIIKTTNTDR